VNLYIHIASLKVALNRERRPTAFAVRAVVQAYFATTY